MSDDARAVAEERIRRVARSLGGVNEQLVYIGASVLPLLVDITDRFAVPRVTKDVDAVAGTASYTARGRLEEALRARGFLHHVGSHAGRWISPAGEIFDLSFAGDHLGGTGAAVDALAIATAVLLPGDPSVRHVSAVGFLSMKAAAFSDRGRSAPHASKDIADIAVLLAGRPQLLSEVSAANENVRRAACDASRLLLAVPELAPAMRSHFRDRQPILPDTPDSLTVQTVEVLKRLLCR